MQLRSELRDKEMKLTDIRLEALSSAHQLDQLRESMNRMQVSICFNRTICLMCLYITHIYIRYVSYGGIFCFLSQNVFYPITD